MNNEKQKTGRLIWHCEPGLWAQGRLRDEPQPWAKKLRVIETQNDVNSAARKAVLNTLVKRVGSTLWLILGKKNFDYLTRIDDVGIFDIILIRQ